MIKRIIALALTILFICFKCLTWVPSAAATGIPAFDAFYYAVLQTLGMAYTNGVEMDLAPAIAEVREAVPDYLQQPDVALKYLLRDYAGKAWDYISYNWENSSILEDVALAETSAIGLANASGVSIPTLQDIVTQWGNKAIDNDVDITTPIDTNTIAFWNKFNKLWINDYLERINFVPGALPDPNPDPTYEQALNNINGTGLDSFLTSARPRNITFGNITRYTPLIWDKSISYYSVTGNFTSQQYYSEIYSFPLSSINITSSNNVYSFDYSFNLIDNFATGSSDYVGNGDYYTTIGIYANLGIYPTYYGGSRNDRPLTLTGSYSGTLAQCINYINSKFKNVFIYVDGVLWSYAGDPITSNFTASVPNSVIDTGTDDGKIVANPIYWVVDNNTGTPIDSQINLDKLIDYLKGVIDGTNEDTNVDFGDLVDAGVIEKQDGTAITDADVIAVPIADVIDDAMARSDPISIPFVITGTLPPLPPLPPFFPTPDFPEGDPTSGFNGMSVLARIVNITNQSLPGNVIVVFYGVVFGAIILGLIKILHK